MRDDIRSKQRSPRKLQKSQSTYVLGDAGDFDAHSIPDMTMPRASLRKWDHQLSASPRSPMLDTCFRSRAQRMVSASHLPTKRLWRARESSSSASSHSQSSTCEAGEDPKPRITDSMSGNAGNMQHSPGWKRPFAAGALRGLGPAAWPLAAPIAISGELEDTDRVKGKKETGLWPWASWF